MQSTYTAMQELEEKKNQTLKDAADAEAKLNEQRQKTLEEYDQKRIKEIEDAYEKEQALRQKEIDAIRSKEQAEIEKEQNALAKSQASFQEDEDYALKIFKQQARTAGGAKFSDSTQFQYDETKSDGGVYRTFGSAIGDLNAVYTDFDSQQKRMGKYW